MKELSSILHSLKSRGFRITKARKTILSVILNSNTPLTCEKIHQALVQKALFVDKTTVYREITFFEKLNLIEEIDFGERKKRYEFKEEHHHHLVCQKCTKIRKVVSLKLEKEVRELEEKLKKNSKFSSIKHSLEFYGICNNCH